MSTSTPTSPGEIAPPFVAVYVGRTDGDYDFVAAFADYEDSTASDIAEKFAENLSAEGAEVRLVPGDSLGGFVDTLTEIKN